MHLPTFITSSLEAILHIRLLFVLDEKLIY
jgi:hypothetical protein